MTARQMRKPGRLRSFSQSRSSYDLKSDILGTHTLSSKTDNAGVPARKLSKVFPTLFVCPS